MRAQLKLLACHISGGEQSGTVFVNGVPIIEAEFKNQLAVVWQSDVLLATATVCHIGQTNCYMHESTHGPSPINVPHNTNNSIAGGPD